MALKTSSDSPWVCSSASTTAASSKTPLSCVTSADCASTSSTGAGGAVFLAFVAVFFLAGALLCDFFGIVSVFYSAAHCSWLVIWHTQGQAAFTASSARAFLKLQLASRQCC